MKVWMFWQRRSWPRPLPRTSYITNLNSTVPGSGKTYITLFTVDVMCSVLHSTSPARYPSSFYSGPPIPLNFEEVDTSADECDSPGQPLLSMRSLQLVHSWFPSLGKDCLFIPSSQNSSFSCTPNSKPLLEQQVVLRSANRSLNIGPKNLMEVALPHTPNSVVLSASGGGDEQNGVDLMCTQH